MIIGRIISWLILATGVGLLAWAVIPVFRGEPFAPEATGKIWSEVHQDSLLLLQPAIERHIAPWLWSDIVQPVLVAPAYLVLIILGILLTLIFRKRRKKQLRQTSNSE
jgi:hypothetical protein